MSGIDILLVLAISLAAALGLTLMGLRLVSQGIQVIAEPLLRRVINGVFRNSILAYGSGLVTAFLVQSGLSTSVMAIGFANSGLLNLPQLYLFLTGVQLGTAATPLIFGLNTGLLDLYFLGIGVFPMLYGRWEKLANVGKMIFGLGLLMMGARLVQFGVTDAELAHDYFQQVFQGGIHSPFGFAVTIVVAVICSIAVRSSVALAALLAALTNQAVVDADWAVVFLAGACWTSALPALWAAREANTVSRRGAAGLVINYLLGLFLLFLGFDYFWVEVTQAAEFIGGGLPTPALTVVIGFAFYRLFLSWLGAVMSGIILRIVQRLIPQKKTKEAQRLTFNGLPHHLAPVLGLTQARQEVQKLAAMTETILQLTKSEIEAEGKDLESRRRILKYEGITDNIQKEVFEFLGQVIQVTLTKKQSLEARRLLKVADELESIADCCQRLVGLHQELVKDGPLDVELRLALRQYLESVMDSFEHVFILIISTTPAEQLNMDEVWPGFRDKANQSEKKSNGLLGLLGGMSGQSGDMVQMGEIVHLLRQISKHSYNMMVAL